MLGDFGGLYISTTSPELDKSNLQDSAIQGASVLLLQQEIPEKINVAAAEVAAPVFLFGNLVQNLEL